MKIHKVIRVAVLLCAGVALQASLVQAQGSQSGTLRGVVKDVQGLVASGVIVTVSSPSLQGSRMATTGQDGAYALRALPPGQYTIKFERNGFATISPNL